MGRTVLVLGDQLSRAAGALAQAEAGTDRIVMVESDATLAQRPWHRQKLAYVLSAMRHFADELRADGFDVSYRRAPTLRAGLEDTDPGRLVVMAPSSWDLRQRLAAWDVAMVPKTRSSWARSGSPGGRRDAGRWDWSPSTAWCAAGTAG